MAGAYRAPPPKIKMIIPITVDVPDDEIKEVIEDAKVDTDTEEEFFDYISEYLYDNIDEWKYPVHVYTCDMISAIKDFMERGK